jgi:hypothetical protein
MWTRFTALDRDQYCKTQDIATSFQFRRQEDILANEIAINYPLLSYVCNLAGVSA